MRDTERGRDISRGRSRLLAEQGADVGLDPVTLGSSLTLGSLLLPLPLPFTPCLCTLALSLK